MTSDVFFCVISRSDVNKRWSRLHSGAVFDNPRTPCQLKISSHEIGRELFWKMRLLSKKKTFVNGIDHRSFMTQTRGKLILDELLFQYLLSKC